jgi:hypothetical protein
MGVSLTAASFVARLPPTRRGVHAPASHGQQCTYTAARAALTLGGGQPTGWKRDGRAHAGARPGDGADVQVAAEHVHAVRAAQAGAGGGIGPAHLDVANLDEQRAVLDRCPARAALAFA